jgi:serine/threonine protein kinase/formylglycine-generating enzyme required for sulfatase activity
MSDKPAPGPRTPQKPPDAEDQSATVPAAGWNDAKTIAAAPAKAPVDPAATMAMPGFGAGSSDAATISQDPSGAKTITQDLSGGKTITQDLSRGHAQTLAATAVTAQVHQLGTAAPTPVTGREETIVTAIAKGDKLSATQPTVTGREATMITAGASGDALTAISSAGQSASFSPQSQSFTRTGRTRINLNLPAEARQLDEKLQLSRSSVLSEMATARFGRGDALPPGIQKLINEQGTEGRYAINKPLAAGGMGAVLAIEDHDFRRGAAMKVIHGKFASNTEFVERFLAEAQVTAQLEHPNIVPIHDLGVMDDGTLYFTMKLIEGQSLGGVVKSLKAADPAALKRWTEEEKILTFLKVLDGVGFAHSKGVVHRDIKPDNIMIGAHGEVLVVDWGIAKVLGNADPRSELVKQVASVREKQSLSQTMEGSAMGTIFYMPPEQAEGKLDQIDGRSDVYALGATLYELLSTKRCLENGGLSDMIVKIVNGNFIPLETALPGVSADLAAIVHRSMAIARERRYQSCAEMADDLRRYLSGLAVRARKRNFIERIGVWYAQHRRQVQAGVAMALLVAVTAVTMTVMANRKTAAQVDALVAKAHGLVDKLTPTGDSLKAYADADANLVSAINIDDKRADVVAFEGKVKADLDRATVDRDANLATAAAVDRASKMLAESIALKAADKLEEAHQILLAAWKLTPGNTAIAAELQDVNSKLANERLRKAIAEATRLKAGGDQQLAQAGKLELSDKRIDGLITQATDAYKQSVNTGQSITGIDDQLKAAAVLREKAAAALAKAEAEKRGKAQAAKAGDAYAAKKYEEAMAAIGAALNDVPNEPAYEKLKQQIHDTDVAERQARAEAETKAANLAKNKEELAKASAELAAGRFAPALEAATKALAFVPNDPAADTLRLSVIKQAGDDAERKAKALALQQCKDLTATAAQALATGDLAKANELIEQALGKVAGDADALKVKQDLHDAFRAAALAKAQAEARAAAAKLMASAHELVAKLRAEQARLVTAISTLDRLKVELAGQTADRQQPLWDAHKGVRTAQINGSELWSQAEAAGQNALALLADQPKDPVVADAKTMLAELYRERLLESRARHDVAASIAFGNLLKRYDDGRYAGMFAEQGTLTITGPAGTSIQLRAIGQGADLRLVAVGEPTTVTLPSMPLVRPGGRYQLSSGEVLISVVVSAAAPVAITWPGALPVIPGMPVRYVPPGPHSKAFLLGQYEVSAGQYDVYIHDPAMWPKVQAAWKAAILDAKGETPLSFIPRQSPNGNEMWQGIATGDKHEQLNELNPPKEKDFPDYRSQPITGISREDAEAYCAWLGAKSGQKVRLPTAAEWQFAANAGDDGRIYPWGEEFDVSLAVTAYLPGQKGKPRVEAAKIGTMPSDIGPFGHYDLAGNAREWLGDRGPAAGIQQALIAGGSWSDDRAEQFRTTFTESVQPVYVGASIGFRILVDVP